MSAVRRAPHLDLAECGCWHGHSTYLIARVLQLNGFRGQLHVFDSFLGLSEFTQVDGLEQFATPEQVEEPRRHFASSEEHLRKLVEPFGFVRVHPGWIPSRFGEIQGKRLGFLSVDVDLYEPTRDSLRHLFPLLEDQATVYVDDCGYKTYPGARTAVEKHMAEHPGSVYFRMPFGSALIVK